MQYLEAYLNIQPCHDSICFLSIVLSVDIGTRVRKPLPFHMLEFAVIAFDFTMI
jgi:hypothetical protein